MHSAPSTGQTLGKCKLPLSYSEKQRESESSSNQSQLRPQAPYSAPRPQGGGGTREAAELTSQQHQQQQQVLWAAPSSSLCRHLAQTQTRPGYLPAARTCCEAAPRGHGSESRGSGTVLGAGWGPQALGRPCAPLVVMPAPLGPPASAPGPSSPCLVSPSSH